MAVKNILTVHIQYNHNKTLFISGAVIVQLNICLISWAVYSVLSLYYFMHEDFQYSGFFLFSTVTFSLYDSLLVSVVPLRLQTLLCSILRKLCWMVLPFVSLVFNFGFNRVPENSQLSLNLQIPFSSFQKHWQLMRHKIQLILQLNYELITTRHKSTQSAPH